MFKSIKYDGPNEWTIIDDDFIQKSRVPFITSYKNKDIISIHCIRTTALINVYESKGLNVANNPIRLFKLVADWAPDNALMSIEQQIFDNRNNKQFLKYKDDVEKYLLLM